MKILSISTLFMFVILNTASPFIDSNSVKSPNPYVEPAGDSQTIPWLVIFYRDLKGIFARYYPQSTSHTLKNKIHFEFDTRMFIVHHPSKTGEWQDPWEERGPKKGGVICDISVLEGRYLGAAVVPQTFDRLYFKHLLLAPYSQKYDIHLSASLRYADASPQFLKEFQEKINSFEAFIDQRAR